MQPASRMPDCEEFKLIRELAVLLTSKHKVYEFVSGQCSRDKVSDSLFQEPKGQIGLSQELMKPLARLCSWTAVKE